MSDRAPGDPISHGQPYILGPAGPEPAQRPHTQAPKPTPTKRNVIFIDGPLAGELYTMPADRSAYLALQRDQDPDGIHTFDFRYTEVCYVPVRGGSQHHKPQPWTCERPPMTEDEYCRALAKAWCHLHGKERP